MYFVTKEDKDGKKPGMYVWTAETKKPVLVKEGKGVFVQPTFDKEGNKLAFLYTDDKKEKEQASMGRRSRIVPVPPAPNTGRLDAQQELGGDLERRLKVTQSK